MRARQTARLQIDTSVPPRSQNTATAPAATMTQQSLITAFTAGGSARPPPPPAPPPKRGRGRPRKEPAADQPPPKYI